MKRIILAFGIFLAVAALVAIGWTTFMLYRVNEGFNELSEESGVRKTGSCEASIFHPASQKPRRYVLEVAAPTAPELCRYTHVPCLCMSLTSGTNLNCKEPDRNWWQRQKDEARERLRLAAVLFPEMALYAWLTLGVFDLSLVTLGAVWAAGMLLPFLAFPMYVTEDDDSPPAWAAPVIEKLGIMDWFGFEFRAFTARMLLFAFVITCVAGLVSVGVSEELALMGALSILALSLPAFLVYYVFSREEKDKEED